MKGRLPELRHLDISQNILFNSDLEKFFELNCKWSHLLCLNVEGTSLTCFNDLSAKVRSGCLSALQDLRVCTDVGISHPTKATWPSLTNIRIHSNEYQSRLKLFSKVVELIEGDSFPSLENIYVTRNEDSGIIEIRPAYNLWVNAIKKDEKKANIKKKVNVAMAPLEISVVSMISRKKDFSFIKQKIFENVRALADSLKDDIIPSKREDFINGVIHHTFRTVKYTCEMGDAAGMGPLLQYKFYESCRDEVEWTVWFDLSRLSFLH